MSLGNRLIARGEVVRDGRRLKVCRSDVFVEAAEGEKLCATALATIIALNDLAL